MSLPKIQLKKKEDRRIRLGHLWIYSNEINIHETPLKSFESGQLVQIVAHDQSHLGIGYINPQSLIAVRLLTRDVNQNINIHFFIKRIKAAQIIRETLFPEAFYRLFFSESDYLPGLIIDRFDKHFVVQINTAGMEQLSQLVTAALIDVFPFITSITLRNDSNIRAREHLPLEIKTIFGEAPEVIELIENNVTFTVPLSGQKTGWFYDHRFNRARLKDYVKNKTVLDVFSYVGGFGVQAAVFGAKEVNCIDASQKACDFIKTNATKNHVANRVNVDCGDAFELLKSSIHNNKKYDIIILDPPAFIKKIKDRSEGLIAYQRINEFALKLLNPDGILISCSCSMHLSLDDLIQILQRASYRNECNLQFLEFGHQGPDHPMHPNIPETNYLKAIFARKIAL